MRHPPPRSTLFPYTTLFRSLFRIDAFRAKQHRTNALRERTLKHGFHREFSRQHALKIDDRDHACVRPLRSSHLDRKSTRLNSSHVRISYAVFCLKKKKLNQRDSLWQVREGTRAVDASLYPFD